MVRLFILWRHLVDRPRVERDLDEKLRAGFEWLVDAKVHAGVLPDEARQAARLEQGARNL